MVRKQPGYLNRVFASGSLLIGQSASFGLLVLFYFVSRDTRQWPSVIVQARDYYYAPLKQFLVSLYGPTPADGDISMVAFFLYMLIYTLVGGFLLAGCIGIMTRFFKMGQHKLQAQIK